VRVHLHTKRQTCSRVNSSDSTAEPFLLLSPPTVRAGMAGLTPPVELHRLDDLTAARSQSQTSLRNEPHPVNNQASRPSCESLPSHSRQSSERTAGPLRQILHDTAAEDHDEQITLLPREDAHLPSTEDPASLFEDADKSVSSAPAVTLHRSGYIVFMVVIYASLALTAWILTCLLTFRPITTKHYGYNVRVSYSEPLLKAKYDKSEEVYRAARTVQAVVTVLTIPLTSAVCSAAAVIFAQSKRKERHLTMRQMMALADKGWTDPTTIARLLTGRGKKYSSLPLICAMLLILFGGFVRR
jgi:hypothetical protein